MSRWSRDCNAALPVTQALAVARALALVLQRVHRVGVVHKDLCPGNVLLGDDGAVALVDFGVASAAPQQSPLRVARLEGTPAYMSPEQTGRMNRPLDWRADHYALGATLHAMLTGAPPFAGDDPLALVHAHLARRPPDVRERAPEVPEVVASIVSVLLAKRPADRYQTAEGLVADLDRCLEALSAGDTLTPFPLRRKDLGDVLQIPDVLYGREADLAALEDVLGRVASGATEGAWVVGAPGVGKTSLVGEALRVATQQRALTLVGKFEQFRRDVPLSAVFAALRAHLESLLPLGDDLRARQQSRLRARLGDLAPALAEPLPELVALLGPLPPPPALPPAEAERRMVLAITALLAALPDEAQSVVLFLDDLQWADASSAALLSALLTDPALQRTLVLGAWRGEEMHDGHAVQRALRAATDLGARTTAVTLAPLTGQDLQALLRDTLGRDDDDLRALAGVLHGWTGGNPFIAHRALEGLRDRGLLRRDDDAWRWELDDVVRRGLGAHAADVVAGRIAELPEATRRALQVAAHFTGAFREGDLAAVISLPRMALRADLAPAMALRLILPEQREWWPEAADDVEFTLAFTHDRVREAALSGVADDDAVTTHLRIGAHLRDRGDADLFEVTHHLNLALPRLDAGARAALRGLNAEAGRKALRSGAFGVASALLAQSVALADADAWAREPEACFATLLDAARAASLSGAHDRVEALLAEALRRAPDPVSRSAALELRARDLAGRDVLGAIDVAVEALRELGVVIPARPAMSDVQAALGEATAAVLARAPEDVLALPELHDPAALAVLRLANAIFAPAYLAVPLLMPVLAAVIVRQTLARGAAPSSTYGFAILAVVLTSAGMFDPGHRIATLSLRLMDRFVDRGHDVRSAHVLWGFVMPFTHAIPDAVAAHRSYHPRAMAAGDHEYAAWISHLALANAFYAGAPLDALGPDVEREVRDMRRLGQHAPLDCTVPFAQIIRALQGRTASPARLDDDTYREADAHDALVASGSRGAVYVLQVQVMLLRYLHRDFAGVREAAARGAPFADGASCTYHIVLFHQTLCLTHAALATAAADDEARAQHLATARAHRRELDAAAAHAPRNHRHRVALLDAELHRAAGDALAAMDAYDAAVDAARTHGFLHEEALAHELAARHHLARGRVTAARAHLAEACMAWTRWGASAKVRALSEEFPDLVPRAVAGRPSTLDLADAELDLATLSKATQAITRELRTDRLVARVLEVCMENAGATRGALLLRRDGALRVAVARGGAEPSPGAEVDALGPVAARVIRYAAGAGEALVLSNALRDKRFGDGTTSGDLSAMALPLTLSDAAAGMIYLENDLTADALSPSRTRMLEHLGAQAAIALENARLYDESEALARAAERFVPREFLAELGRNTLTDVVPGDARELVMSVLFADLRGFTGLTERLGPAATFALLNAWLSRTTEAVRRHGGFVKDIIGDGTLALFSGDPEAALRAASEIAAIPDALGADVPLRVGIGVDRGPVTLGTLGSAQRLAISVVGDAVNSAARLESATKGLATRALVSERFVAALRPEHTFALRPLGPVSLHGREAPLAVYESLDVFPDAVRARLLRAAGPLRDALDALRAGDVARAEENLRVCLERCPDDTLARGLLARVQGEHALGGKDDVRFG
ncbi:MAG: AAA family ATPase [Polyangiales bacterium]